MRTVTKQFMAGQVRAGDEFTALVGGVPTLVRVVAVQEVVRGTDEAELELLDG